MIGLIIQGTLFILMVTSLVALIDGVLKYRNSPLLAWLKQRIEELDGNDDKD